jgi:uncharacterized protein YwqG
MQHCANTTDVRLWNSFWCAWQNKTMSRADFERSVRGNMPRHAERLIGLVRPSICVTTQQVNVGQLDVGASRVGGWPDLPMELPWPTWDGGPLDFLAQFKLGELASLDLECRLPPSGWLLFFWDVMEFEVSGRCGADRRSWRVVYLDTAVENLRRCAPPTLEVRAIRSWEHGRRPGGFPCCRADFVLAWLPPPLGSGRLAALTRDERETYSRVLGECGITESCPGGEEEFGRHQLLGHPQPVQANVELEAYASAEQLSRSCICKRVIENDDQSEMEAALRWRLLLQLDTDYRAGMMWGDCGRLYFLLREDMFLVPFQAARFRALGSG